MIPALEVVGRLGEVAEIASELAGRPDTRIQGLIGLAKHTPAAVGPAEIEEIARSAGDGPVETRINAGISLGGMREALGDCDGAFAAFMTPRTA